jgi:[acyl-carrier-protein] S-malonyltransferase
VIPATFTRLSENVQEQTMQRSIEGYGIRAMSGIARRPWLASLLPSKASLLRAPYLKHIVLEDWLLEHVP